MDAATCRTAARSLLKNVQQLSLVFMDPLDLHVEHRRNRYGHAEARLHIAPELLFVLQLALSPSLLECRILGKLADRGDDLQVAEEVLADRLAQKLRQ